MSSRRFVIFGAGAVGGVLGARLHQSGENVLLIARGEHRRAIAERGLRVISPEQDVTLPIPVAGAPGEAELGAADVIFLTVKGQDTLGALTALRDAAPADVPVVTAQNGVANEALALRLFSRVYGLTVLLPATHLEPGVVVTYGTRFSGTLDLGRIPDGVDELAADLATTLRAARFESTARADIMTHKYAKLIANLGNAVQAVCGTAADTTELTEKVRAEGRAVLSAAGIPHHVEDIADLAGRWERWGAREVPGHVRGGGSTWQSVTRGTGAAETDYLNGEIVLEARRHGLLAPLNAALQDLIREGLRSGYKPGWRSPEEILESVA